MSNKPFEFFSLFMTEFEMSHGFTPQFIAALMTHCSCQRTFFQLLSIISKAMIKVYFDKNVLSHILAVRRGIAGTNGVTNDDLKALLEAVAARKIVNLLSPMQLQEAA